MQKETRQEKDPDHTLIVYFYGVFGLSLILSLIPSMAFASIVVLLITLLLIACYIKRHDATKDSFKENHLTYIIRTIWIGTIIGVITTIAGGIYMRIYIDYTPIYICIDRNIVINPNEFLSDDYKVILSLTMKLMKEVVDLCMDGFIAANKKTFLYSTLISAGPVVLYFILRFAKGFSKALSGHKVEKSNSIL